MLLTGILLLQFTIGFGVIDRFEFVDRLPQKIALSILLGFFISTLSVFALELLHIKLTVSSILLAFALTAVAINFNIPRLARRLRFSFISCTYEIRVYELVFLLAIGYLLFFSVWRSYAIPVTPYDAIVGIDLVAKQAVKEGHIVSSVFSRPDLKHSLSTQPYYAPFTMLMQVIYRSAGLPFGQLWLGILTTAFFAFAYSKLCERIQPVLAGFFLLTLITVPELYAYTFLLQTDFSNAVFFSIGMIFLLEFLDLDKPGYLCLGTLFMAAGCWSRTETIILTIPVGVLLAIRSGAKPSVRTLKYGAAFLTACACSVALWNVLFFKFYFPVVPKVNEQIHWAGIYSVEKSGGILRDMSTYFFSTDYWGHFIYIFLALWAINLLVTRHWKAVWPLAWIVLFYFCFFIMLHHFKLMNIEYTFRRAIMKFLLLMCLMIGRLDFLQRGTVSDTGGGDKG